MCDCERSGITNILNAHTYSEQIEKTLEELEELAIELITYKRNRARFGHEMPDQFMINKIRSEIADVRIMMAQLTIIFGPGEISEEMDRKIDRELRRITERKRVFFRQTGKTNIDKGQLEFIFNEEKSTNERD